MEFRCAQSGARFVVQSSRRSPLHKFAIQAIKNAPPRSSKPIDQVDHGVEGDLAHSMDQLAGPKPVGLLGRLFGRSTTIAPVAEPSLLSQQRKNASAVMTRSTYDADQYNWSSFICPYCSAKSFIKCAGGHLACNGTVEIRSGRRFHQCFCGNAGFIEGTIKTIEANQRAIEQTAVASTNPKSTVSVKEASTTALSPPAKKSVRPLLP